MNVMTQQLVRGCQEMQNSIAASGGVANANLALQSLCNGHHPAQQNMPLVGLSVTHVCTRSCDHATLFLL